MTRQRPAALRPILRDTIRNRRIVVLSVIGVAGLMLARFAAPDYAIDDAWISFRIARNWLQHGVPTFDLARPPVEGMTNFLWTLLTVPLLALRPQDDPIHAMRVLGALGHLATVVVCARLAGRLAADSGGDRVLAMAVGGGLPALSGALAFNAASGLETGLWALLFVLALDRLHAALRGARGAPWAAGVLLGLLGWARPEGVLAGALMLAGFVAAGGDRTRAIRAALPFVALIGALEAFRWIVYGSLVPNTYFAKQADPDAGFRYLRDYAVLGLGVLGPIGAVVAWGRGRFQAMVVALAVILATAAALTGGDWMPGFRRLVPATLGLAILLGDAMACSRGGRRGLVAVAAGAVLIAQARAGVLGEDAERFQTEAMEDLARRAAATPAVRQVALLDIGRFGYHYPGSIYDFAGLTDRRIARAPGSHLDKTWDETYFRERSPELVLVPSDIPIRDPLPRVPRVRSRQEMLALQSILVNGGYRYRGQIQMAPDRYLLVFRRNDVELPPALWGPVPPKDLRALLGMPAAP